MKDFLLSEDFHVHCLRLFSLSLAFHSAGCLCAHANTRKTSSIKTLLHMACRVKNSPRCLRDGSHSNYDSLKKTNESKLVIRHLLISKELKAYGNLSRLTNLIITIHSDSYSDLMLVQELEEIGLKVFCIA